MRDLRTGLRRATAAALAAVAVLVGAATAAAATPSLYVATGIGSVSQYTVGAGGGLSAKTPPTVAAYANATGIAISPDGRSAYATTASGDQVYQYTIGADGNLTPKNPASVTVGSYAQGIAVSPSGTSVYVVRQQSDELAQFNVGADGTLTPKTPATVATGLGPQEVAVSPDGHSVYVTDLGGDAVSQYDVGAGGALTAKTPATVAGGGRPYGIVVSPDGGSVYVADSSGQASQIAQFDVAAGGGLVAKTPASVSMPSTAEPHDIAVSPDGAHVYTADYETSGEVSAFDVGGGGALTSASPASVAAGGYPTGVAVSPDGASLYVSNIHDSTISQFDITAGGGLSAKTPATVTTAASPAGIAVFSGTQASGAPGAPTATVVQPADGATYTVGQNVPAQYSCTPGASGGTLKPGVAGCTGPIPSGSAAIDTSTAGTHTFSVTATDTDGQTATATTHYTVTSGAGGAGSGGSGGGGGSGGSGGAAAAVASIRPIGQAFAGRIDTVSVQTTGDVSKLRWSLAGASSPNVTCDGRQTELSFKATAGATERVSVTGVTSSGITTATQTTLTLGRAPAIVARTPAARVIQKVLSPVVAQAPRFYECSPAPGRSFDVTDPVRRGLCVAPSTIQLNGVEVTGCLRKLSNAGQVPAGEQAILAQLAPNSFRVAVQRALGLPGGLSMLELLGNAYFCEGLVRVNGVDLAPNGDSSLLILPLVRKLGGSNVSIGIDHLALKPPEPDLLLNLGSSIGGEIPLGQFARDQSPGTLRSLGGFGLVGDVGVSLVKNSPTARIVAHVQLPGFLTQGGVSAQAPVTLTANTDDGLLLDNVSLGPVDAQIASVPVDGLTLQYTRGSGQWVGQGRACISDSLCLDMIPPAGGVTIAGGQLVRAAISQDFAGSGLPVWDGVNLTHVAGGIGLQPTRIFGSAGIRVAGLIGIDGAGALGFPDPGDPFILAREEAGDNFPSDFYHRPYTGPTVAVGGDASLNVPYVGSVGLGSGYVLYEFPGYLGFGGGINQDFFGVISLSGGVDGELNAVNGRFSLTGHLDLCVADVICGGAIASVSSVGAGGCVSVGPLNIGGGVVYRPFDVELWPFDGCKWTRFIDMNVFSGNARRATAATDPIVVHIKPGDRSRAIRLDGATGAPDVHVTGPGGVDLDSPTGAGVQIGRGARIIRSLTLKATVVGLVDPRPGTYTLTLDAGSPPVTRVSEASDQPDARIHAAVHGTGATRTLSYDIGKRPDQQVTFIEVNGATSRQIATVKGDRGSVGFTPAPGRGTRTIVAQFQLAGLPAERLTVARFTPPSPVLPRARTVRVRRHGRTLLAHWRAVRGADRYTVVLTAAAGGQRVVSAGHTQLTLRDVDTSSGGVVSVSASAPLRTGRPASARYRATTSLRTPAISPLHPPPRKRRP